MGIKYRELYLGENSTKKQLNPTRKEIRGLTQVCLMKNSSKIEPRYQYIIKLVTIHYSLPQFKLPIMVRSSERSERTKLGLENNKGDSSPPCIIYYYRTLMRSIIILQFFNWSSTNLQVIDSLLLPLRYFATRVFKLALHPAIERNKR